MPLAAQLRGSFTAGKTWGFSHSHMITSATGISAHQPNYVRLQIAKIPAGMAAKRVYTLQGLACRSHAASGMPALLTNRARVITRSLPNSFFSRNVSHREARADKSLTDG